MNMIFIDNHVLWCIIATIVHKSSGLINVGAMMQALTVQQVADILNVNERTVYRMVTKGELPGFRVAGSWRFLREDLESWVTQQKAAARSGDVDDNEVGA